MTTPLTPRRACARSWFSLVVAVAALFFTSTAAFAAEALGEFAGHTDIGGPARAGTVSYDAATGAYVVGGGGENMWFRKDSFHYVWKKMDAADLALTADIEFPQSGGNNHRKGVLMIRQTLDADSAYADIAVHGDGLTSLQFRDAAGDVTHEVQTAISAPKRVRLEKVGDYVYMSLAGADGVLRPSGCSTPIRFQAPFYVGIGVCAHDDKAFETVRFTNVSFGPPSKEVTAVRSSLEFVYAGSADRRSLYYTNDLIEAPNWAPDGSLIFNGGGRIYRLNPGVGAKPVQIDTGEHVRCNNDHGLTPDGKTLIISDGTKGGQSRIYTLPVTGGTPREITPLAPSYWHGVSPDGKTLAYCAQRDGKFGIFTIPIEGGEEKRLTITDGLDDGPDYSPDGKWIYFNSDRTGRMQIWRMHPDGTGLEQVTNDEYNNWFPHPSPDGKSLVILSYAADVKGHPRDKDVMLRLLPVGGTAAPRVLVKLFGGQGSINVPSWSPDSTKIAYVRYQPAQPAAQPATPAR